MNTLLKKWPISDSVSPGVMWNGMLWPLATIRRFGIVLLAAAAVVAVRLGVVLLLHFAVGLHCLRWKVEEVVVIFLALTRLELMLINAHVVETGSC